MKWLARRRRNIAGNGGGGGGGPSHGHLPYPGGGGGGGKLAGGEVMRQRLKRITGRHTDTWTHAHGLCAGLCALMTRVQGNPPTQH